MPKAAGLVRTREGKSLLKAAQTSSDNGVLRFGDTDQSPISQKIADAIRRVEAQVGKHEQITWDEKFNAFAMMGYKPTEKMWEIAKDVHQIRVVRAGRRSGKTTHAAHEAAAVMLKKPGSFGWVVGPYYSLTFRCWTMMVDELDKLARQGKIRYLYRASTPANMRIVLDNGSVAEGKSGDMGDSLQGVGLDWLIMDEIAQIESWVFMEILMPAFIQQRGWAFLIGTPLGESWASREFRAARARNLRNPVDELIWAEYLFESWHNTYEFPGGRNDPEILKMERNMSHADFMQQVCARPQRSQFVTYKEFDEEVHGRHCPYTPGVPVWLAVDPSTGVNPYAVAVFQDYGDTVEMIDEYYKVGVLAQDICNELRDRLWWEDVEEAIFDDASPNEKRTWAKHPDVHFICKNANKPGYIEDSIPLVRAWLRDPTRYNRLTAPLRDEVVEELHPGKLWAEIEYEDQNILLNHLDTKVDDHKEILVDCARFFVDRHRCRNAIDEFHAYAHKRPKKDERNVPEVPMSYKDHLMDCIRMWIWNKKRYHGLGRAMPVVDPYAPQL